MSVAIGGQRPTVRFARGQGVAGVQRGERDPAAQRGDRAPRDKRSPAGVTLDAALALVTKPTQLVAGLVRVHVIIVSLPAPADGAMLEACAAFRWCLSSLPAS